MIATGTNNLANGGSNSMIGSKKARFLSATQVKAGIKASAVSTLPHGQTLDGQTLDGQTRGGETRGGYVRKQLDGIQINAYPSVDGSASMASRLAPVQEAYDEAVRITDAEFAAWNRAGNQGLVERGLSHGASDVHSYRMSCECLEQSCLMDLVEHVLNVRRDQGSHSEAQPILIHVTDYQEAVELDRRLAAFGVNVHLASPFSNWTSVLGKLGTGQIEVIISTTVEIPHVDQIAWKAIYLPSSIHLAMLTTPALDWLGNYWFANNLDEVPPRLIVRRQAKTVANW